MNQLGPYLVEAKWPKAALEIMAALEKTGETKVNLSELAAYIPRTHYAKLERGAEFLKKKGIIKWDGVTLELI